MVSSTFYDLRQIRADLARFIRDDLGYEPLLSEFPTFPIDPDVDTIENCRRRVEHDADVLILVIGGRSGYADPASARSVTNLEYRAARAKGIPVFAFVEKRVLTLLSMWVLDPGATFEASVEPAVFPFIQEVRTADKVWTREFETAQDIVEALRPQFAHLMRVALDHQARLRENPLPPGLVLGPRAYRIAVERPKAWEWRLFAELLCDSLAAHDQLRRDQTWGVTLGSVETVPSEAALAWCEARLAEIMNICRTASHLVDEAFPSAYGPAGVPSDLAGLAFVACRLGDSYKAALMWQSRVRHAKVPDLFADVVEALEHLADDIVNQLPAFGPALQRTVAQAATSASESAQSYTVTLELTVPPEALRRVNVALSWVRARLLAET
jgi:hypothetical protein